MTSRTLFLIAALAACGKGNRPSGGGSEPAVVWSGERLALGDYSMSVPAGWVERPAGSAMRRAEYELPGADGAGSAELVVYFFGPQGAGSVDANLERWYGQFEQPDGRPSKDAAVVERMTLAGAAVTRVDLAGRYVAQMSPGAAERHDQPGWRMLAAIVDGGQGAYYLKLVGPERTVARWQTAFNEMVASLRK